MHRIKPFSVFESSRGQIPGLVDPAGFAREIGLPEEKAQELARWWSENRPGVKIHLFRFKMGVVLGAAIAPDAVAINSGGRMAAEFKVSLLLHESYHTVQNARGPEFHDEYFGSAAAGDEEAFSRAYLKYEREANDEALAGMRALGLSISEHMVRGNEHAAMMVYPMMRRDIASTGARDVFELISKQLI